MCFPFSIYFCLCLLFCSKLVSLLVHFDREKKEREKKSVQRERTANLKHQKVKKMVRREEKIRKSQREVQVGRKDDRNQKTLQNHLKMKGQ